jgi:hypothetical protein
VGWERGMKEDALHFQLSLQQDPFHQIFKGDPCIKGRLW